MIYKKNMELIQGLLGIGDNKVNIYQVISDAIGDHAATVEEGMSLMMSPEDLEDLKNGDILFEALKLHVKVWCEMGKLNKNSNYGFP